MLTKTIISGFGGQGVLFMGYCLATAAMEEHYHTTYLPSYGAEPPIGSNMDTPSGLRLAPAAMPGDCSPSRSVVSKIKTRSGIFLSPSFRPARLYHLSFRARRRALPASAGFLL